MGQIAVAGAAGHRRPGSGTSGTHPGDAQIARLRTACHAAVSRLVRTDPEMLIVVGGASHTRSYPPGTAGSLAEFGVPFSTRPGGPVLPLSLTIGTWLVRETGAGWPAARLQLEAVAWSERPADCLRHGAVLAARAGKVALLVMGDGSARPVIGVHGAPDPQSRQFDDQAAGALAAADAGALAALPDGTAAQCLAAGRAAWHVLAGAALATDAARGSAAAAGLTGQLMYAAAPLDVTYFVALWT